MTKRLWIVVLALILLQPFAKADEGMWMPILLEKYNIEDMQKAGFKLSAEDIYDINKASLKDAVVGLGYKGRPFSHFCSAELISDQGLILTNHHCGFGAIQRHSSVEHDYLTDGFWAFSKDEELANPWMTASFLKYMEDVTSEVFKGVTSEMSVEEHESLIQENISAIIAKAEKDTHYRASIKQYFAGNEYYMSVYEIFEDVRLVGAPPSAIGKFGGDTDNWTWPRHTGDFSMFRIYASENNEPKEYTTDNQPYKPLRHFEISIKGINEGDFTMVLGYPGTTEQHLPSHAVEMKMNHINPLRIELRGKRLDIMNRYMEKDKAVRIQYASKNAGISNGWKKWIGENQGMQRFETIKNKQILETEFDQWAKSNTEYQGIISQYKDLYSQLTPLQEGFYYALESVLEIEIIDLAGRFARLVDESKKVDNEENIEKNVERLLSTIDSHFKNYYQPIDKEIAAEVISMYFQNAPKQFLPQIIKDIEKKFKGDFEKYSDQLFEKSIFADKEKLVELLNNYSSKDYKKIEKDPAYQLHREVVTFYQKNIQPDYSRIADELDNLDKIYVAGLRKMQSDKVFYPDANSAFRVSYGQVKGYDPKDGVQFKYQTTLTGIIEKDNPDVYDYRVPEKLKELYASKNFGEYTTSNGDVPVCFVGTNHTTGGNSGSPVLDAEGRLIGINFDRAWEGVMSDITYKPEICRNIMLDVRFVLFIVDKFAGAQNLIDEMSIVK